MLLRKFSHPVYIRRLALGWSLDDLEARSGVDKASLSRYEAGVRCPTYRNLRLMAQAFSLSTAQLVHELESWESIEVTPENAERVLLDAFWAYTFEHENLDRDWQNGLCEDAEKAKEENDG